ncbi:hypothetical protein [Streptomyces sp. H27-H5]|uniref:hypothetical protein n=1 Tax=Streptomyces sp. H27-H5 TaxID=2996460 RepID=UPI0022700290|nr:hypothetical protein [Streptomyces sp. H27-H5]MCY0955833.1 hypothetical protein [Streptomyces sp. H27-H5]
MNTTLKTNSEAFAGLVAGVAQDSPEQVAAVRNNVERAQADTNNAMMGGWVSDVA